MFIEKKMYSIKNGLLLNSNVIYKPSVNINDRPLGTVINLLVIHCASLPEGEYDNNNLELLFTGEINNNNKLLELGLSLDTQVSTHLYIKRSGEIIQFVPFDKRAWHAGVSEFQGRTACNDFSIGIELQGTVTTDFTTEQYHSLINTTKIVLKYYPEINLNNIIGHSAIAPSRKKDPGERFNWQFYLTSVC